MASDLHNKEQVIGQFVTSIAKAINSFKKQPLKNASVRLIALIFFFLNTFAVQKGIDILVLAGIDISFRIAQVEPWYSICWGIAFLILFSIAVYNRIKDLAKRNTMPMADNSPIKGLLAFDFHDADMFKNLERNTEIQQYKNALLNHQYKVGFIMGVSGCGKTSLIKAGLTPSLREHKIDCVVVTFTNKHPLHSIYEAIQTQMNPDGFTMTKDLLTLLWQLSPVQSYKPLILIFDQFEQFFTQNPTFEERRNFIEQIEEVCYQIKGIKFLFSIRTDFFGSLHELQSVLKYQLDTMLNYFNLLKFQSWQIVNIIRYISQLENVPPENVDDEFIKKLAEKDLASEDGLISAANVQILLWIIKGQRSSEGLNFTEKGFKKLGGVGGLLQDFLEEQLAIPNSFNQHNEVLYCLLALINTETNVCAGQLTLQELQNRLPKSCNQTYLPDILNWLEKLRLVNRINTKEGDIFYELAHERLIEPIRNIENKVGIETIKASQLLERRTNEWLGNQRNRRYYLSISECRLILKNKKLITFGNNESIKKEFLNNSCRFNRNRIIVVSSFIVVLLLFLLTRQSIYYKINYKLKTDILNGLSFYNSNNSLDEFLVSDLVSIDSVMALKACEQLDNDRVRLFYIKAICRQKGITASRIKSLFPMHNAIKDGGFDAESLRVMADSLCGKNNKLADSLYHKSFKYKEADHFLALSRSFASHNRPYLLEKVLKIILDSFPDKKAKTLLSIAESLYELKNDLSGRFYVTAINSLDTNTATSNNVKEIIEFAEINAKRNDSIAIAHYKKGIHLLSKADFESDYSIEYSDNDLNDLITSLFKQNKVKYWELGVNMMFSFHEMSYCFDQIQTLCDSLRNRPYESCKKLFATLILKSRHITNQQIKIKALFYLSEALKETDPTLSKTLENESQQLAGRTANHKIIKSLKKSTEQPKTGFEELEKGKTFEYYKPIIDSTISKGFMDIKLSAFISFFTYDTILVKKIYTYILSSCQKNKNLPKEILAPPLIYTLKYDKRIRFHEYADSLLTLIDPQIMPLDFVQIVRFIAKENQADLKKYRKGLNLVVDKLKENKNNQNSLPNFKSICLLLSEIYSCMGEYNEAYACLIMPTNKNNDSDSYSGSYSTTRASMNFFDKIDTYIYFQIQLYKNYQKRKNFWAFF